MLSFVQLDKPHIDIELYGTDTNIAPIDKVYKLKELEVLETRGEMLLAIIVMVL